MRPFEYRAPERLDEVHSYLDEFGDDAKILAGGQSLMVLLRQGLVGPELLVSLKRVAELASLESPGGRSASGGHGSVPGCRRVRGASRSDPVLTRAAASVGSVHIRNVGTVGGSLCHADPAGDVPTALLVLDAELRVSSSARESTHRVGEFFVGLFETRLEPSEVLESISIPEQPTGATFGYRRFLYREGEYPLGVAACRLDWDGDVCSGARVAVGGGDVHPKRLPEVEQALIGTPVDGPARAAATEHLPSTLQPIPDVRGSAGWKAKVVGHLVAQAVEDAAGPMEDS